jgi:hypothetical protein
VFGGLFGVFNDFLPDGWGLLLMDRELRKGGIEAAQVCPLDRLTYIGARAMGTVAYSGTRAMGAPTYHPPAPVGEEPLGVDLAVGARQAERIVEGNPEEVLAERLMRTTRGLRGHPQSDTLHRRRHRSPDWGSHEPPIRHPTIARELLCQVGGPICTQHDTRWNRHDRLSDWG